MASGTKSDVQRLLADVATGGSATAAACIFTNPLEVVKTRLQLQGEMQGCTTGAQPQRYKGVADAIVKMARQEGAAALQKGLAPGMVYQVFMNGTRLGCYPTLKRILNTDGADNFLQALGAGAPTGRAAGVGCCHCPCCSAFVRVYACLGPFRWALRALPGRLRAGVCCVRRGAAAQ